MTDKINQIVEMTSLWQQYINIDSHKDSDCHFYIETKFSYADEPVYKSCHYGYIADSIEIVSDTYEEALDNLITVIKLAFRKELDWGLSVLQSPKEWTEDQHKKAEFSMINFKMYLVDENEQEPSILVSKEAAKNAGIFWTNAKYIEFPNGTYLPLLVFKFSNSEEIINKPVIIYYAKLKDDKMIVPHGSYKIVGENK